MADARMANFSSCCRLCVSDSLDNMRSIFDENTDGRELQQKILVLLGVEISADDKLSTMVCLPCIEKINNWQSFKGTCYENQAKLEQWMQMSTSANDSEMNILIKEEPFDHDPVSPEIIMNGEIPVKNESMEEYSEYPPSLTPNACLMEPDIELLPGSPGSQVNDSSDDQPNPRQCTQCGKLFSSSGNRRKHEKMIHGVKRSSDPGSLSQDDRSQSSIDSTSVAVDTPSREPTNEERKILFAAGLKLLQRNSSPPISFESLSRIENSYIEKCKAMVTMHQTLRCACHNVTHPNLKGLLSHLRALRIWFPVFTCYHCMITFTDRSTSTRHYLKCPRSNLETLIKLSNLKKRSEVKTRLYQNYKCVQCRFMFSFHEDFCTHVDEDHSHINLPYHCTCGRVFDTFEDYKDHAYISCLVDFYCDICFVTVKTLDAFKQHAAEAHDNSEGFTLLQDDNYKQRRPVSPTPASNRVKIVKREYTDETNIVTGKRRTSCKPPIIEPELDDDKESKFKNMHRVTGTVCPICSKEYSSNNNMWRHYKTHVLNQECEVEDDQQEDGSLYCCPDCGEMFDSEGWDRHKEMHHKKACNVCGKVFQFQSELDQHRIIHLNLKLTRDSKTQNYTSSMASDNIMVMCEHCDQMFTTKEQLKQHKLIHENKMPVLENSTESEEEPKPKRHTCKICDKSYANYGGLWTHNKKEHPGLKSPHTGDYPKQCEYCDRVFYTGSSYFGHKQMHQRNNDPLKRSETNSPKPGSSREEDPNDQESYYTCNKCFKVFATKSNLRNHMRSHGINVSPPMKGVKKITKKVWCNICHCAFESSSSLQRHKVEDHGGNNEMPNLSDDQTDSDTKASFIFTCNVCVQTFTTREALKKHKERHAREKPMVHHASTSLSCKYCKLYFPSAQQLQNHMQDEHLENYVRHKTKEKLKSFTCKPCRKSFKSAAALYAHQGWHKRGKLPDLNAASTSTPKIKETFTVKQEPKDDVPRFKCTTCGAVLPNDTALQIHILEKHRNINTIMVQARCSMCNLDFQSQDEYEQHKKFHTMVENKPKKSFNCNQCPAAFSKLETLKTHTRQFHQEQDQEFKCNQCGSTFDKRTSLSLHLKVHEKQKMVASGAKPLYSCSICNMGFDLPKDLRAHTIQAHPF